MLDSENKVQKLSNTLSASNLTYVESNSSTYTFTNLSSTKDYKISAYVIDKKKIKSNTYEYNVYSGSYVYPSITNVTTISNSNSITATVTATKGTNNISKYYYSIDGGNSFIESTSNSYTFTNLVEGSNYKITIKVIDSNNKYSNIYVVNKSTTSPLTLAKYVISQYGNKQGNNNIYHHDGTLENGIDDGSYRYAGPSASVYNYVCFGSDESSCPDDNLFRIIGVFGNQTKVIRANLAGSKFWHTSSSNIWSTSSLNIYLNGTYLTNLGIIAKKIATTTWKVGGGSWSNLAEIVPSRAYQYEVGSSASTTTYDAKIGLMYVSDYYYGASPSAWKLVGMDTDATKDYRAAKSTNWIYSGTTEWTISPLSDTTYSAYYILGDASSYGGRISAGCVDDFNWFIRPTFFLNQSVKYISGSGTSSDPIIID